MMAYLAWATPGANENEAEIDSASARVSSVHTLAQALVVHQGPSWTALDALSEENGTAAGLAQVHSLAAVSALVTTTMEVGAEDQGRQVEEL